MRKILMMLMAVMLWANGFTGFAKAQDLIPSGMPIEDAYRQGVGKPVGTVVMARGEVVIIHKDDAVGYRAKKGLNLFEADTVVCLDESLAILETTDGSRLSLAARTSLKLTRSVFNAREKDRSSFFNLAIGKTRFWVTKLANFKRSEVRVMTPTAILGVRGSDFIVAATETTTQVTSLDDTLLEVFNRLLPEQPPVMLTSFQRSMVEGAAPPTPPVDITPEQAADIVKDVPTDPQEVETEKAAAPAASTASESQKTESAAAASPEETTKTAAAAQPTAAAKPKTPILVETGAVIAPEAAAASTASSADSSAVETETRTTSYRQTTFVEEAALIPPEAMPEALVAQPESPYIETFDSTRQEEISSIQETQDSSLKEVQEEKAVSLMPDFPKPPQ